MDLDSIDYEVRDHVAPMRLSRGDTANVVNRVFAADFKAVMLEIEWDDDVRAVSVTADGKLFSAGGDLKEFYSKGADLPKHGAELLADFHSAIYKMNRMPKPFVAGVRGGVGGAGLSLVGAFDLVVSGESAKYTMAYTRAGMTSTEHQRGAGHHDGLHPGGDDTRRNLQLLRCPPYRRPSDAGSHAHQSRPVSR